MNALVTAGERVFPITNVSKLLSISVVSNATSNKSVNILLSAMIWRTGLNFRVGTGYNFCLKKKGKACLNFRKRLLRTFQNLWICIDRKNIWSSSEDVSVFWKCRSNFESHTNLYRYIDYMKYLGQKNDFDRDLSAPFNSNTNLFYNASLKSNI